MEVGKSVIPLHTVLNYRFVHRRHTSHTGERSTRYHAADIDFLQQTLGQVELGRNVGFDLVAGNKKIPRHFVHRPDLVGGRRTE